uniref:C-X-C motif chemokine n=1 Tax=Nothoprocta perdicaria TaxID=30464 RepID=A0A8C6YYC8_NOTPE
MGTGTDPTARSPHVCTFVHPRLTLGGTFIPLLPWEWALPPLGAPLAGELRCRCVRTVSEVIPPRRLASVELIPEGPHCAVPEVIAKTKQGLMVCLNPSAPWVQRIVTKILNSKKKSK